MTRVQAVIASNEDLLNKIGMTVLMAIGAVGLVEELVHLGGAICIVCTSLFGLGG